MKRRLIIADNHPLFRSGVRQIIDESNLFYTVAEVGDGESCVFQVLDLKPDYLVLDLGLPGKTGFEVVEALKQHNVKCRIVILSMHSSAEFVTHARQLGCHGFIAKEDAGLELINILTNESDNFLMSSSAGTGEKSSENLNIPVSTGSINLDHLTPTEIKILKAISEAQTSREIADRFGISDRTVHTHRQNISTKLDLKGVNSLVRYAFEHKAQIINS